MSIWNEFLTQQLNKKRITDNHRYLQPSQRVDKTIVRNEQSFIDLTSNDYLGVGQMTHLMRTFTAQWKYTMGFSSSSSPLLTGYSPYHAQLEKTLTQLFNKEAALLFSSGYTMNIGVISALADKNTLIIADKYVHASIIDGILLSKAPFLRFAHNDITQLTQLVQKYHHHYARVLIVTESLFSMDGDIAPLPKLVALKNSYSNVALYVDEAHAVGVRGKQGLGIAEEYGCLESIDFLVGTFGKALYSTGAYVLCSTLARDYLLNHTRSFIFSTALPAVNIAWSHFIFTRLTEFSAQRHHLAALSSQLHDELISHDDVCLSNSHIVPIIMGSNQRANQKAQQLQKAGFLVMPIRPPTVPNNQARIRVSLNATISQKTLKHFIHQLYA